MHKAADISESQEQINVCRDLCYLYCRNVQGNSITQKLFPERCGGNIPPSALEFKTMLKNYMLQLQAF